VKEEHVFFRADDLQIEGLYGASGSQRGAVIAHPHPQMGGSMNNSVVEALVQVYSLKGVSTLRFNFRGVGRSEGYYDNGDGEQADLIGASAFLNERNKNEIMLAGYSFGAWIITRLLKRRDQFSNVILVSPPIDYFDIDFSGLEERIGLVICGENDQFSNAQKLKDISEKIKFKLYTVQGADHFYWGREGEIAAAIGKYLAKEL